MRRIVIRNDDDQVILSFPLSAGVVGAALLPMWAAIGAVMKSSLRWPAVLMSAGRRRLAPERRPADFRQAVAARQGFVRRPVTPAAAKQALRSGGEAPTLGPGGGESAEAAGLAAPVVAT